MACKRILHFVAGHVSVFAHVHNAVLACDVALEWFPDVVAWLARCACSTVQWLSCLHCVRRQLGSCHANPIYYCDASTSALAFKHMCMLIHYCNFALRAALQDYNYARLRLLLMHLNIMSSHSDPVHLRYIAVMQYKHIRLCCDFASVIMQFQFNLCPCVLSAVLVI